MGHKYLHIIVSALLTLGGVLVMAFTTPKHEAPAGMIFIKGGSFLMGAENGLDNEKPVHKVTVNDFYLDANLVTVAQFDSFVTATGYKTDAEKFGDAAVYNFEMEEWELLKGANWQFPEGPMGQPAVADYPVTQVSWNDAVAYCQWAHKRLPTEAEWEYAARQGVNSNDKYSWGKHLAEDGKFKANVWQGKFPEYNTGQDGYFTTSPVGWYGKTKNGLSDMGGNVWEWCADSYKLYNEFAVPDSTVKPCRGGSFLCDSTICHGYRVSSRMYTTQESATYHVGFRCAKDVEP